MIKYPANFCGIFFLRVNDLIVVIEVKKTYLAQKLILKSNET